LDSVGCPLFPGENEKEQLQCIMEVKGLPDASLFETATRKKLFFGTCILILSVGLVI